MVLSPNDEEVANSSKKHTQFKTRVHKPYPISDQMVEIDTLFQTKTAEKPYPFGFSAAHTYVAYIRDSPPGRKTRCRLWVSLPTQARLIVEFLQSLLVLFFPLVIYQATTKTADLPLQARSFVDSIGVDPGRLSRFCEFLVHKVRLLIFRDDLKSQLFAEFMKNRIVERIWARIVRLLVKSMTLGRRARNMEPSWNIMGCQGIQK